MTQPPLPHARRLLLAAVIASLASSASLSTQAGLFKIDFGQLENERVPVDENGTPLVDGNGNPLVPPNLVDWTVIPTWTFGDPNGSVTPGSASANGVANADGTAVTWKLLDASSKPNNNVTLTIFDNLPLADAASSPMLGMTANNTTKEGIDVVYDGVRVPARVKDDYLYRNPDAPATESLMRVAGLEPGTYSVTVFEGRTTDSNGRYGKIWVDDIRGLKAPASENTGNYSGTGSDGSKLYKGQPRTKVVTLKAGEYLWFAEMEDNSGGISGMVIRSVDPVDSPGLFKLDFGHLENERSPVGSDGSPQLDPDGVEVGPPAPLKDWDVIPTWTFDDPNGNVTAGSASIQGTPNGDGTAVTWKLKDFSNDRNTGVTLTILDNKVLADAASSPMTGQTANNPTKEGIAVVYDGVLVPAVVKDDYLYRSPDAPATESLMRIAGLKPGRYNVTVFEGRTTDGNGRFGKVCVDDIRGLKEPASQNTGNYAGTKDGKGVPLGQSQTVTVDVKAGEFLGFAEMEDNSGGISGMIIRGIPSAPSAVTLQSASALGGAFTAVSGAT
ncbi:MAG: hypothetical protein ACKO3N_08100, partial [Verrucomicrobiota bacterium]